MQMTMLTISGGCLKSSVCPRHLLLSSRSVMSTVNGAICRGAMDQPSNL